LEDNFIYTEDPGKPEKGKSGLEQFLESHKGYDVHYATAATLMFRYYGIPARYVEGYLITDADARSATENGTVVVPRSRAHAWTEIYIDGVGYVPLEVTPEFYGIMKEADLSIGISNESLMRNFEELYGNQTEEPEPETSKANGNQGGSEALKILWIVLAAIAGAGLLVLLGFLLKAALTAIAAYFARKKLFEKSDPKTAVSAIYGYMEEKELSPGPEIVALGNTAAYSRKRISEKQRRKMLAALKELQKMNGQEKRQENACFMERLKEK
ncbi:MAG: transglutaminase domain-containing protein, partial [Parasporobacterium sp.]|nr:transglutaminase domain-containing protein [Parasporobacterium sp.]